MSMRLIRPPTRTSARYCPGSHSSDRLAGARRAGRTGSRRGPGRRPPAARPSTRARRRRDRFQIRTSSGASSGGNVMPSATTGPWTPSTNAEETPPPDVLGLGPVLGVALGHGDRAAVRAPGSSPTTMVRMPHAGWRVTTGTTSDQVGRRQRVDPGSTRATRSGRPGPTSRRMARRRHRGDLGCRRVPRLHDGQHQGGDHERRRRSPADRAAAGAARA